MQNDKPQNKTNHKDFLGLETDISVCSRQVWDEHIIMTVPGKTKYAVQATGQRGSQD